MLLVPRLYLSFEVVEPRHLCEHRHERAPQCIDLRRSHATFNPHVRVSKWIACLLIRLHALILDDICLCLRVIQVLSIVVTRLR